MDDVIGMNMKQLRLRVKLRTVDTASRIGVAESSVRNWEKGRTIPTLSIDKTAALCLLYQCSIAELDLAVRESIARADRDVDLELGEQIDIE